MGKTLAEVREECRSRLAEPSPDFFSDEELNRWISRAHQVWCEQTGALRTAWKLDIVADQGEYPLPNDLIRIEHVWYRNDTSSDYAPLDYRDWSTFSEWPSTSNSGGNPSTISLRRDNMLVFDSVPTASCTNALILEGQQEPLDLDADEDEVFRPKNESDSSSPYIQRYWDDLVYFVLWKAAEKDQQFDKAQYAQAQWQRAIAVAKADLQNQIAPRRVRACFCSGAGRSWPRIERDRGFTP